mmetsp:Transcript_29667/g.41764  ORF Transcript_29667/g.41764 Transcript_29667/m.41764 type:complete len:203 (-) Transcript_29667:68-676(-)
MDNTSKLFYIRKTLTSMLYDRGYLVPQQLREETLEEFKSKFADSPNREALTLLHRKKDDPTDQIFVFFPDEIKVGVKTIRGYLEKMKQGAVQRAIIVVQQGLSSFAKQALSEMAPRFKLEQFIETELLVNITEHVLVPKHIKLSREEKAALLERYKLKESQLPRMQITDPVARYFGLERGDVVKIVRKSETAGRYITYRLVA